MVGHQILMEKLKRYDMVVLVTSILLLAVSLFCFPITFLLLANIACYEIVHFNVRKVLLLRHRHSMGEKFKPSAFQRWLLLVFFEERWV